MAADLNELERTFLRGRLAFLATSLIERGFFAPEIERVGGVFVSHEKTQTRIKNQILNERITSS
jgi:hypothetical protein